MINLNCIACNGELRDGHKTIETVDPSDNYTTKKAKLLICKNCSNKMYLEVDSDSK